MELFPYFLAGVLLALLLLLVPGWSWSAALPVPVSNSVNTVLAKVVNQNVITRGFAANDPLIAETMTSLGTETAGMGGAGVLDGALAVSGTATWMGLLFLGAVATGSALVDMATQNWQYQAQGYTVTRTPQYQALVVALPTDESYQALVYPSGSGLPLDYANPGVGAKVQYPGDAAFCVMVSGSGGVGGLFTTGGMKSGETFCAKDMPGIEDAITRYQEYAENYSLTWTANYEGPSYPNWHNTQTQWTAYQKQSCTISQLQCPDGILYSKTSSWQSSDQSQSFTGVTLNFKVINNPFFVAPGTPVSLDVAAHALDDGALNATADPQALAQLANQQWQAASQMPGYQGVPYDPNHPITAADVAALQSADPSHFPRNANLFEPVVTPVFDPNAQPSTTSNPQTEPQSSAQVDLGPNPNVGSPTLEDTPTGSSIVDYVMGLMPGFMSYSLPGHTGTCPTADLTLPFSATAFHLDPGCTIAENNRALISGVMLAVWSIVGLGIVLRA